MNYAICNETFGDWPLEQALQFAARCGYRGWEVAPFMLGENWTTEFDAQQRADYRGVVESAGLSVIGLHWLLAKTEGFHLTTRQRETRQRTADYFRLLAELCRDLGGHVMVLGSPGQRNLDEGQTPQEGMENAAEVLREIVPTLNGCGVRIALEPLGPEEGNFLNTADEAVQLQRMVGDPSVGLHLDVKAMSTEAESCESLIRRHADDLIHFHANDPNRQGPGMGDVAFAPILQSLQDIGYDGWVSVEVFDYSPGIETLVGQSIDNLQAAEIATG